MVIFTLTLLAFFISLSMQMMNQLFLGQSMGVAIAAVILPLVLSLILSLSSPASSMVRVAGSSSRRHSC